MTTEENNNTEVRKAYSIHGINVEQLNKNRSNKKKFVSLYKRGQKQKKQRKNRNKN